MPLLRWLKTRLSPAVSAGGPCLDARRLQSGQAESEQEHAADVVLYTREGCHLCDEARAILESYGLRPKLVDIDADEELVRRYTNCVPVVVLDGQERFRGRVNEVLLRRLLRARASHS